MRNFQYSAFPRLTPAVANILFANIILFVVTYLIRSQGDLSEFLGAYYPSSPKFHAWQIITHMFMHGGLTHILFNMFGLYTFGIILENVWGTERFVYFYFLCGLGAIGLQFAVQAWEIHQINGTLNSLIPSTSGDIQANEKLYAINEFPTIGASGAIFGILTAFALLFPNTELMMFFVPIPIKAKFLISGYIIIELYLGIQNNAGDNVAHFAHLGGALIGFLILKYWNSKFYKRFY